VLQNDGQRIGVMDAAVALVVVVVAASSSSPLGLFRSQWNELSSSAAATASSSLLVAALAQERQKVPLRRNPTSVAMAGLPLCRNSVCCHRVYASIMVLGGV
jgi:hypothetical protein